MIIWFIGISGAGKTTLGTMLKKVLDKNKIDNYLIDGDIVRDFFNNDLGFSKEDRIQNVKRIMLASYLLSGAGNIVIVCNISPFEDLRQFIRKKEKNYIQIYLKKSLDLSKKQDVKGVYKKNKGKTQLVGIDIPFEEPANSELVINVDKINENESLDMVIDLLKNKGISL